MKKQNLLTKLLLLCAMIVGGVNASWADTELVNIDFTDEETGSFTAGSSKTIDGTTVYSKSAATLTNGSGLKGSNNAKTSGYWFAIPISGIDGSIITISLTCGTNRPSFSYYIAEYDELPVSYDNPSS